MTFDRLSPLLRYAIAVIAVLVVLLLKVEIAALQPTQAPFRLFFAAVHLSKVVFVKLGM